jgi:hypothetical protein
VANDDFVFADEDFLDEKTQHALPLSYIERFDGRPQAGEEVRDGFGEAQADFALLRLVFDCLQLQQASLFASAQIGHAVAQLFKREKTLLIGREQTLNAFSATREIAAKRFLSALRGIGVSRRLEPPLKFVFYETLVFEQTCDLFPYNRVQQILAHWAIVADRPAKPAPTV